MYGYVTPIKSTLACGDFALYRSFYCGMCKLLGKQYGQLPRLTTNYDITFLSVLLHEYAGQEYRFENKGCILNPFRKKVSVTANPLFEKIAAANVILSFHKAADGVVDREGFKYRVARGMLKKAYKSAKETLPKVDGICNAWYNRLRELEKDDCSSPDRAADCFANLLKEVCAVLLDEIDALNAVAQADSGEEPGKKAESNISEEAAAPRGHSDILSLAYNVGKFVYLADALDDVDSDFFKKRYNPFLAKFGGFTKKTARAEFIEKNREELEFVLASAVNRAIESFNNIQDRFINGGHLVQNILYEGLREKCKELLNSKKKLKKPKV